MQTDDVRIDELSPGLIVGLTQLTGQRSLLEQGTGDDAVKFLFQLEGEASFSANGVSELRAGDLTTAIAVHGPAVTKTAYFPSGAPSFSVVIVCQPLVLVQSLGVDPARMPRPVAECLQTGRAGMFWEAGRMSPQMAAAVRGMRDTQHRGVMRRAYLEARATELVCDLCSEVAQTTVTPIAARIDSRTLSQIERVREQIDEHYAKTLSAQALARAVGTNVTKLSTSFRDHFGMTVFEYVRLRRMEEGRRLLRTSGRSVTEIAFDVGYEHPCNFAIAFKRHFGVTPREDRRAAA